MVNTLYVCILKFSGKEVYVIQSGSKRVNNDIFELLTIIYACRTSSAGKIVG